MDRKYLLNSLDDRIAVHKRMVVELTEKLRLWKRDLKTLRKERRDKLVARRNTNREQRERNYIAEMQRDPKLD